MMKKKVTMVVLVIALMAVASLGTWAIASSGYGTSSDPLITLSYLNDTLMPEILADFQERLDAKILELTESYEAKIKELEDKLDEYNSGEFALVSLRSGQSVTCSAGAEVMLRSGSAAALSDLSDLTGGETLSIGGSLSRNHMYVVLSANGGLGATSDATLLIRGTYTIN